jgi:energy-coupling factor transporter ATPase
LTDPIIQMQGVHFHYNPESEHPIHALRGIDLDVQAGDYLVIVGHNGSGKSTLAKNINVLLRPTEGDIWVKGMNTREAENALPIRSSVGMVFQVPDNQIVATIVEQDVAFGPENLGVPRDELLRRVDWALDVVEMTEYRHRPPHRLSAGQKQRVAIAGAIAMKPDILILDEATALLDPKGRKDVLSAVRSLNEEGMTVIAITHFMHEAVEGNRVIVIEAGKVVLQGTPRQVFDHVDELRGMQLDVPQPKELAHLLNQRDPTFPTNVLLVEELVDVVERRVERQGAW